MIKWIENNIQKSECSELLSLFDIQIIEKIQKFHKSFPQYSITPMRCLDKLAEKHNVGGIYVKDESERFNLSSFKALGCTFAIASVIAQMSEKSIWTLDYETLRATAKELGEMTFYAATDGNHGRAVAWTAKELGHNAIIYMNKGCPQVRADHIIREGATVKITDVNYDDTIRQIRALAEETPNSIIIQDTGWEDYQDIPLWIMQGYAVMALEACEQLSNHGITPTHVILQAGVGAFAGSAQAFLSNYYNGKEPVTIITEPDDAACYYKSVLQGDGKRAFVDGDMITIMAGLACGEPNPVSWDIIKSKSKYFTSIDDEQTIKAMNTLANPYDGDPKVISGESGAAGMGLLLELLTNDDLKELREKAGIDKNSHILIFSTEGKESN